MAPFGSMATGLDHDEPFHVVPSPSKLTMTQKLAKGHDTESLIGLFGAPGSIAETTETGVDQELPFQLSALPKLSTAIQKLEETQETELRP